MSNQQNFTRDLLLRPDLGEWSEQLLSLRGCSRPIRLRGTWMKVDNHGEILSEHSTDDLPAKAMLVRCGNRRASVCPSCSHEYKGDMWHLLSAGTSGGKGVPESVATHPMIFLTLTAPSFGPVHSATSPNSKKRCHSRDGRCEHGRPLGCFGRHVDGDDEVGTPICEDCYDYDAHVVWQWWAPELWRRFTIAMYRRLAEMLGISERQLKSGARLQFVKVAEFQARGAIHFHALIRLDAPASVAGPYSPSALTIDAHDLVEAAESTVTMLRLTKPLPTGEETTLQFGTQTDARVVNRGSSGASPQKVAAYLAKYSTKASGDEYGTDGSERRVRHAGRLRRHARSAALLDRTGEYSALRRWSRAVAFRGHFASKSRTFSTTLKALRGARREFRSSSSTHDTRGYVTAWHLQFDSIGWRDEESHVIETRWADREGAYTSTPLGAIPALTIPVPDERDARRSGAT